MMKAASSNGGHGDSPYGSLTPNFELQTPDSILEVKDLQIHFFTDRGVIRAVEGVDFSIRKQEVWGLVGESASGKSVRMVRLNST